MKKPQNNTLEKKAPRTLTPLRTIEDLMGWKTAQVSDIIVENLCEFLLDWSLREDAISLTAGLREFGMPPRKFYDWEKRSQKIKDTYMIVKTNIGDNLFRLAVFRKGDPHTINRMIHKFHGTMNEVHEEEKEFKTNLARVRQKSVEDAIKNLTIVERSVKKTDLVNETVKRRKRKKE